MSQQVECTGCGQEHSSWRDQLNCLDSKLKEARIEIERLQGLRSELPPRAPEGNGLPRYGLRWNGPTEPLAVQMSDGYWTPWHLANYQYEYSFRSGAESMRNAAVGVCQVHYSVENIAQTIEQEIMNIPVDGGSP